MLYRCCRNVVTVPPVNKTSAPAMPRNNACMTRYTFHSVTKFNTYKPDVPFLGHKETVQTWITRRINAAPDQGLPFAYINLCSKSIKKKKKKSNNLFQEENISGFCIRIESSVACGAAATLRRHRYSTTCQQN